MIVASRPLRGLAMLLAGWCAARTAMLLPGAEQAIAPAPFPIRALLGVAQAAVTPTVVLPVPDRVTVRRLPLRAPEPVARPVPHSDYALAPAVTADDGEAEAGVLLAAYHMIPRPRTSAARPVEWIESVPTARGGGRRLSGDAYLFLRDGGGGTDGLAPVPQLGGGEAFARLAWSPDPRGALAVIARASAPIDGPGGEAALGLRWGRSVSITVERRVGLAGGGRDAWSAYVAGGIDARPVGPFHVDAYGQAGLVGARRRDGFIDAAVRAGHPVGPVTLGAGAWGAAQPGAARFDMGPRLATRFALPGGVGAVAALDWRMRIAGRARPGNGVALTLAAGF